MNVTKENAYVIASFIQLVFRAIPVEIAKVGCGCDYHDKKRPSNLAVSKAKKAFEDLARAHGLAHLTWRFPVRGMVPSDEVESCFKTPQDVLINAFITKVIGEKHSPVNPIIGEVFGRRTLFLMGGDIGLRLEIARCFIEAPCIYPEPETGLHRMFVVLT